ncbi:unnamed protein product [Linum tenue]|uniref:DYW domain-containing protein n=1 Tax=Linum tenue TaxID=586396 RepID=A0AAV0JVE3_9ROSI|nr:unnamed protein product [Linum tenue]
MILKYLRICGDCHSFMKSVSLLLRGGKILLC